MNDEAAFPYTPTDKSGQIAPNEPGMSLRDYFAAKAMAAIHGRLTNSVIALETLANSAYKIADAMLAERSKPPVAGKEQP